MPILLNGHNVLSRHFAIIALRHYEDKPVLKLQYHIGFPLLKILTLVTASMMIVGMIAPLITLKKFIVIENTFSLLSGAVQLIKDGQWFLFIVVTLFSIILPIAKLTVLYRVLSLTDSQGVQIQRYLYWIHRLGKWSMLDVFVVAILLVTVKLGFIASVELHYGIYAFATAILLSMYITGQTVGLLERQATDSVAQ